MNMNMNERNQPAAEIPHNLKNNDLRVLRTYKLLLAAMTNLLTLGNFRQITVNSLCAEAMVSRTAFYSHFNDKYALLKYWLTDVKSKIMDGADTYGDIEERVNGFANNNRNIIKNLIEDADGETSELFYDCIFSVLNTKKYKTESGRTRPNEIILSNFCRGGITEYLLWQVNNKFPPELPIINPYIYNMLKTLQKWNDGQK